MPGFLASSPEREPDPCLDPERRRRGDCGEEAEAALEKTADGHTLLVNGLIAAGLVVLAAAAVIWVPFLEPIRDRFAHTQPGWVIASFVLQLLSVLSFVVALRGAFDRRLAWRESFDVGVVEESANVFLPSGGSGGLALGAVILIVTLVFRRGVLDVVGARLNPRRASAPGPQNVAAEP